MKQDIKIVGTGIGALKGKTVFQRNSSVDTSPGLIPESVISSDKNCEN